MTNDTQEVICKRPRPALRVVEKGIVKGYPRSKQRKPIRYDVELARKQIRKLFEKSDAVMTISDVHRLTGVPSSSVNFRLRELAGAYEIVRLSTRHYRRMTDADMTRIENRELWYYMRDDERCAFINTLHGVKTKTDNVKIQAAGIDGSSLAKFAVLHCEECAVFWRKPWASNLKMAVCAYLYLKNKNENYTFFFSALRNRQSPFRLLAQYIKRYPGKLITKAELSEVFSISERSASIHLRPCKYFPEFSFFQGLGWVASHKKVEFSDKQLLKVLRLPGVSVTVDVLAAYFSVTRDQMHDALIRLGNENKVIQNGSSTNWTANHNTSNSALPDWRYMSLAQKYKFANALRGSTLERKALCLERGVTYGGVRLFARRHLKECSELLIENSVNARFRNY